MLCSARLMPIEFILERTASLIDHWDCGIARVNVKRMSLPKAREHWRWTACGSTNCSNALPPPANMSFMIEPGDTKWNLSSDFIWQWKSLYPQPHQNFLQSLLEQNFHLRWKWLINIHEQIAIDWKNWWRYYHYKTKDNRSIISELLMTESINLSSPLSQVHFLFQSIQNIKLDWCYHG